MKKQDRTILGTKKNRAIVKASDADKARVMSKVIVDPESGCWNWSAGLTDDGYGSVWLVDTSVQVHRAVWSWNRWLVCYSRELDHLCRNRRCCNPEHLEMVTEEENIRRGESAAGHNARKTHCPQGHPYSGTNSRGERICQPCERETKRRHREKRRSA